VARSIEIYSPSTAPKIISPEHSKCAGSYEYEKCVSLEKEIAGETTEARSARQRRLNDAASAAREAVANDSTSNSHVISSPSFTPSFDCAKATSGQEKMVCGDRELSKLDVELAQAYAMLMDKSAEKDLVKKEQLNWIRFSFRACSDKACLKQAYNKRMSELQ
jgi:uncharacterized protein YecT (DUF1311 family)